MQYVPTKLNYKSTAAIFFSYGYKQAKYLIMGNWAEEALADYYAEYKAKVTFQTWGHLAPSQNKLYQCKIWFSVSEFAGNNIELINYDFGELDSSPWIYEAVNEFLGNENFESGSVYSFTGTFKNYNFKGKFVRVIDTNAQ